MKKRTVVLAVLSFALGAVVGASVMGVRDAKEVRVAISQNALSSVADEIKIAAELQPEQLARSHAVVDIERTSATSIIVVKEVNVPIERLGWSSLQGLCAAYVYLRDGGYSHLGSPAIKGILKKYLDIYGPLAIRRLGKIRSTLGAEPFKRKYAWQLGLKPEPGTSRDGKEVVLECSLYFGRPFGSE